MYNENLGFIILFLSWISNSPMPNYTHTIRYGKWEEKLNIILSRGQLILALSEEYCYNHHVDRR